MSTSGRQRPETRKSRVKPSPTVPSYVKPVVLAMRAGTWRYERGWNAKENEWVAKRPARSPKTGEKILWSPENFDRTKHLWGTFGEAYAAYEENDDLQGVYLLIEPDRRFEIDGKECFPIFFDLDDCRDPETGEVDPWATRIVKDLDTYTEISPSGKGLRCIALVENPDEKRMSVFYTPDGEEFVAGRDVPKDKRDDYHRVEVYGGGAGGNHLITFTGRPLFEKPVQGVQGWVDENAPTHEHGKEETDVPPEPLNVSDEELMRVMLSSKDRDLIRRLMKGDRRLWEGEGSRYESRSAADQALFRKLAFYARGEKERMVRIANSSRMRRGKWKREEYLEDLVTKGIKYCKGEFYDPAYSSKEKLLEGFFGAWMGLRDPKLRRAFGALLARVNAYGSYTRAGYRFDAHGEEHVIKEEGLLAFAGLRDLGLWMGEYDHGNVSKTMKELREEGLVQKVSEGKGSKGTLYLVPSSLIPLYNIEEGDTPRAKKRCLSLLCCKSVSRVYPELVRTRRPPKGKPGLTPDQKTLVELVLFGGMHSLGVLSEFFGLPEDALMKKVVGPVLRLGLLGQERGVLEIPEDFEEKLHLVFVESGGAVALEAAEEKFRQHQKEYREEGERANRRRDQELEYEHEAEQDDEVMWDRLERSMRGSRGSLRVDEEESIEDAFDRTARWEGVGYSEDERGGGRADVRVG